MKQIPEGATHCDGPTVYYKFEDGIWKAFFNDSQAWEPSLTYQGFGKEQGEEYLKIV